jgi:hypothetical protein
MLVDLMGGVGLDIGECSWSFLERLRVGLNIDIIINC